MMRTMTLLSVLVLTCGAAAATTSGSTVDLLNALDTGQVQATFYGAGEQAVTGRVQRTPDGPQSLQISPGTQFWAQLGGRQGQTTLGQVPINLNGQLVAYVHVPTCCTNIGLPAATVEDAMIPVRCPDPRLAKLLGLPDIRRRPHFAVQTAVWALANNPRRAAVLRILTNRRQAGDTFAQRRRFALADLAGATELLETTGLDPAAFRIFR